jgi:regulator of replication initiation timing
MNIKEGEKKMENFDVTKLTNEELSDLLNKICSEKQDRAKERQRKLIDALKRAWDDVRKEGFDICYNGEEIYFDDIEIY